MSLGGSGALAVTNGALDVVTTVVPRLAAANTFTGLNTFPSGVRMGGGTQPTCDMNGRGLVLVPKQRLGKGCSSGLRLHRLSLPLDESLLVGCRT